MKLKVSVRLLLPVIFILALDRPTVAQQVVVVVRHADKVNDTDDAALSAKGEQQAKQLAHVLKDFGISAIYVTQFQRTKRTAAPLAALLKIKPVEYEQKDVDWVAKDIREKHAHHVVMVVGHRSTVPLVLQKLGCADEVALA